MFVFDQIKLVGDEKESVAVHLSSFSGGSRGAKYLAYFGVTKQGIVYQGAGPLKAFLRPDSESIFVADHPLVSDLSEREFKFATYSIEDAIWYADLDGDGNEELITAYMLWIKGECHWCSHQWIVGITELGPVGTSYSYGKCGSISIYLKGLTPAFLNGYSFSVSMLGQINPLDMRREFRNSKPATAAFRKRLAEEKVCDESKDFTEHPEFINFVVVPQSRFDFKESAVLPEDDSLQWPTLGTLTGGFSENHPGISMWTPLEVKVRAIGRGEVIAVSSTVEGRFRVEIKHANEMVSFYEGLKSVSVLNGATVFKGQPIGVSGNSDDNISGRLFFGITLHGVPVNPLLLLPR